MAIKIADAYISITTDDSGLNSVLSGITGNVSAWNVAIGNLLADAIKGVIGLVEDAASAMGEFLVSSIDKAANFQQKMADVKAVMGLTVEETQKLSDLAINLGLNPTLKVTTLEAADAIKLLGKQGLDTTEILNGAALATVQLSNATGGDMKTAAVVASQAVRIFGLDVNNLTPAIDSITGVVNNSKASLNDYRLGLSQGGFAAKTAGLSFADFNTILAQNLDAASSASQGGTILRMFLQSLTPDTKAAAAAMRELGLMTGNSSAESEKASEDLQKVHDKINALDPASKTYETRLKELTAQQKILEAQTNQGTNAFYNMDGSLKSASEITQILHDHVSNLNDMQKEDLLTTIFHSRGMQFAADVASHTGAEFDTLSLAINKSGNASESGKTRMDTLRGAMEILDGVIEAIQIKFGTTMLAALQRFNLGLGAVLGNSKPTLDFFQKLGDYIASLIDGALTPMAQKWLPIIIDHLLKLGDALLGTAPSVTTVKNALDILGQKIVDLIDWLTNVVLGTKDFATWLGNVYDKVKAVVGPILEVIGQFVSWKDVLIAFGIVLTPLLLSIGQIVVQFAAIVVAVGAMRKAWETDWGGIRTYTTQVVDELRKTISTWLTFTTGEMSENTAAWQRVLHDFATFAEQSFKQTLVLISGLVSAVLALARGDWKRAWDIVTQTIKDSSDANKKAFDAGLDALKILFVDKAPATGKALTDGLATGIKAGQPGAEASIHGVGTGVIDNWQRMMETHSPSQVFFREGANLIQGLINGFNSGVASVIAAAQSLASQVIGSIQSAFNAAMSGLSSIGAAISSGIAGGISGGTGNVTNAAVAVVNAAKTAATEAAQIASPSRLFSVKVGLPIAEGIGAGILDGLKNVGGKVGLGVRGLLPAINATFAQGNPSSGGGLDMGNVLSMLGGISSKLGTAGGGVTIQQNFYFSGGGNSQGAVMAAAQSGTREALRQVGLR